MSKRSMPKTKKPTDEQIARVVNLLETYGDGSEPGVFRNADVDAARAVALMLATPAVCEAGLRLHQATVERLRKRAGGPND